MRFNSYIIRATGDDSPAICPACGKDQPMSMYYAHSVRGDGAVRYRPYCRDCRRKKVRSQRARPVHAKILETGRQFCKWCNTEKPISEFYSNGCFRDGTKKYRVKCKLCVLDDAKKNNDKTYKTKSEKRSQSPKNFISGILNHATRRKQNLGFDIDLMYLLELFDAQGGKCALTGVQMTYVAGSGKVATNISIDRIDSSKGYVRDNVQFVCDVVNRMKQELSCAELFSWCGKIVEKANGKL